MRVLHAAIATACFVGALARDSDACSCSTPLAEVRPAPFEVAPLTTHVFVATHGFLFEPQKYCVPGTKTCGYTKYRLALRTVAAAGKPSMEVAFDTRRSLGDVTLFLELVPKHNLAAKTRYEIVRVDDAFPDHAPTLFGTFATGAAADNTKPTWSGSASVEVVRPKKQTSTCVQMMQLKVSGALAKDASPVVFALWFEPSGGVIDYAKPPDVFHLGTSGSSVFQVGSSDCQFPWTSVPSSKKLRVGVAPVDLAGRRATVSETLVDTSS